MTSTTTPKNANPKLIHIGCIFGEDGINHYLFLRKISDLHFVWFEEHKGLEKETDVSADNIEEALRLAVRRWKSRFFRTVICGFRYTLPERDEHGINALFHQMAASYSSMNGIYYDEELGNNCFVQSASQEAYDLWQQLKTQQRI